MSSKREGNHSLSSHDSISVVVGGGVCFLVRWGIVDRSVFFFFFFFT